MICSVGNGLRAVPPNQIAAEIREVKVLWNATEGVPYRLLCVCSGGTIARWVRVQRVLHLTAPFGDGTHDIDGDVPSLTHGLGDGFAVAAWQVATVPSGLASL